MNSSDGLSEDLVELLESEETHSAIIIYDSSEKRSIRGTLMKWGDFSLLNKFFHCIQILQIKIECLEFQTKPHIYLNLFQLQKSEK